MDLPPRHRARAWPIPAALLAWWAAGLGACLPESPPRGPERACVSACEAHAGLCSARQCRRGCALVIDRYVEGEGNSVLACVARPPPEPAAQACDDRAWARCATRVGVYADGGPPAPPSSSEDDFEDEGE